LYVLTANLVPLGFLWYFMHKKTFLLGRARKWMTMGAPFGERYGTPMKIILVLVVLVASVPYVVAQIQGIGVMLEAMSDGIISFRLGLFFVPFFIAIYLMMGGMKGAAWVNAIQGVFFSIMVFVLFFFVMMKNGGFVPTMELVMAKHPNLFQIGWAGGKVWSYPMIFGMASAMALGCVCFPQPYMHAYSSRSVRGLKAMFLSFGGICLFVITMPTLIGAILSTLAGVFMNVFFFVIGGKNMVFFPQKFMFQLNGFLASFIIAGIVFFVASWLTKPGKIEEKSLKLFFHPMLEK
jgi:SSS family solute:Na+ symporter